MKRGLVVIALMFLAACAGVLPVAQDPLSQSADRYVVVTLRNAPTAVNARAGSSPRHYPSTGYDVAATTQVAARSLARKHQLTSVAEWPIAVLDVHCIVYRVDETAVLQDVITRLQSDPLVESAQPMNTFATLASEYNDPYFPLQRSLPMLGVPQAHRYSRGDQVKVAVVDTAVDTSHPDLKASHIESRNFTDASGKGARHGTAVAGVIAASVNNSQGIVGIAPGADVHAFAACWPDAQDSAGAVCNTLSLAKALAAAVDLHADIVNLSLGGPSDPLLRRIVAYGLTRGMIFVCAQPAGVVGFPCDVPGVINADTAGNTSRALHAPGREVLTLVPGGRYDYLSGSSLAAAHVTGSIALLLAHDEKMDGETLRTKLARTEVDGSSINICAALASVDAQHECRAVALVDAEAK